MEVAITGASGLIGSAVARSLHRDAHTVRPLVRPQSSSGGEQPDPAAVGWDPAAGTIDADRLEGLDAVVHLAGAGIGDKRWSAARKREIRESRTRGTDLLARTLAGLERPPAVLLSASGVHYYGDRGDEELTEASAAGGAGDGFLAELVPAWEAAAQPAIDAGIRTVFLRNGVVLSADGGALPRLVRIYRWYLGGPLGSGRQWMSWVSIDDEVGAVRFLIERHDLSGPVNVVAPDPVRQADFAQALGSALGRPARLPTPAFGPRLVLGREMADQMLFVSQRVLPTVLTGASYRFVHPDLPSALGPVLARS
jgi:uncharacterized protein (TIGR01777 family)